MGDIISNVGQFISSAVSLMVDFVLQLTPGGRNFEEVNWVLFLFCICIPLVGLGIGLLRRVIKTRG